MARPKGTVKHNLVGKKFCRYTVIKRNMIKKGSFWECECECGRVKDVSAYNLMSGTVKSCGCYHKERVRETQTTHGRAGKNDRTYKCYWNMITRCTNPNNHHYYLYGARGIKICDRWLESFLNFLEDMGEQPEGFQIERKDNNGNYELSNCIWLRAELQVNNKRHRRVSANKKSGLPLGVSRTKDGKFLATLQIKKVRKYLGVFRTVIEAECAVNKCLEENNVETT